jgi:hypothetical protein
LLPGYPVKDIGKGNPDKYHHEDKDKGIRPSHGYLLIC